jgi:hypothetical protein
MAVFEKKKYQVTRMFGYQKPMQVGEEILLTEFEAVRYGNFLSPMQSSVVPDKEVKRKEEEVNELDKKPNKKIASNRGRRKSK